MAEPAVYPNAEGSDAAPRIAWAAWGRRALSLLRRVLTVAAVIWASVWLLHWATASQLPSPTASEVFRSFPGLSEVQYPSDPSITAFDALRVTLTRVLWTTVVALGVGLAMGFLFSYFRRCGEYAQPGIDLYRSIPVTFFIPATTLILGSTNGRLPWILAAIPCACMMVIQVRKGAQLESERVHAFQVLAGSKSAWRTFISLRLRAMIPDIATGLRLTVSYAIVIVSVLEYMNIGSEQVGFGLILHAVTAHNPNDPAAYAAIFAFGLIGFVINIGLERLEDHVRTWRGGA